MLKVTFEIFNVIVQKGSITERLKKIQNFIGIKLNLVYSLYNAASLYKVICFSLAKPLAMIRDFTRQFRANPLKLLVSVRSEPGPYSPYLLSPSYFLFHCHTYRTIKVGKLQDH